METRDCNGAIEPQLAKYPVSVFLVTVAGLGWIGTWVAPLWNVLFGFLFMRDDVRTRLDPASADRREVGRLLDEIRQRED